MNLQALLIMQIGISAVKVTYKDMIAVAIAEFVSRRPQFLDDNK